MALVNWRNAATHPPTEPGWYPTLRKQPGPREALLRWFDGKRFSYAVSRTSLSWMAAHAHRSAS